MWCSIQYKTEYCANKSASSNSPAANEKHPDTRYHFITAIITCIQGRIADLLRWLSHKV